MNSLVLFPFSVNSVTLCFNYFFRSRISIFRVFLRSLRGYSLIIFGFGLEVFKSLEALAGDDADER